MLNKQLWVLVLRTMITVGVQDELRVQQVLLQYAEKDAWRQASERARVPGERYLPPCVTGEYVDFFERLLA